MFVLILFHFVTNIASLILALVQQPSAQKIVYWVFNIISPSVNAQAIVTYLLAEKSRFCSLMAGFIPFFTRVGDDTMAVNWIILILHIIIPLALLIAIDCGFIKTSFSLSFLTHALPLNENVLDSDVSAERQRILNLNQSALMQNHVNTNDTATIEEETDHLIVHNLVKRFPGRNAYAVNHLTFGAKRGEAFGLLGYNVSFIEKESNSIHFLSNLVGCW